MKNAFLISILTFFVAFILCMVIWNLAAYRDIEDLKENGSKYLSDTCMDDFPRPEFIGYKGSLVYGGVAVYQTNDWEQNKYIVEIVEWRGSYQYLSIMPMKSTPYSQ